MTDGRRSYAPSMLCLTVLLLSVGGCQEPPTRAEQYAQDEVALKRGKALFIGSCGGYCHGTSPGPRDAPFLFDCTWKNGGSDNEIFGVIANGVPTTRMMSFKDALPEGDDDIWRLVAFIKAVGPQC